MAHYSIADIIAYEAEGIFSKVVLKDKALNVSLFCMAAGTDIGVHTSTKEGTVFIIEGEGTFTLGDEPIAMNPGVLIHMKADQPHSILVIKDTSFLLTLIN